MIRAFYQDKTQTPAIFKVWINDQWVPVTEAQYLAAQQRKEG
jgi:hypothetical protein